MKSLRVIKRGDVIPFQYVLLCFVVSLIVLPREADIVSDGLSGDIGPLAINVILILKITFGCNSTQVAQSAERIVL